jgi:hypothetical protein
MKNFVFAMSVAILVVAPMTTSAQVATSLHCDAGEVQVCTAPTTDGSWEVLFDTHARPRFDCDVATDTGVDLRCVDANTVCADAKKACEGLNGDWRWSERRCRCYQHVERDREGGSGSGSGGSGSGNGNGGQGGGDTNVTVVVQTCDASDFAELSEELDQIDRDLTVVAELHPLQLRATAVYSRLLECDDGSAEATRLISRAAQMIANFEPEAETPHDYTDQLELIREEIAGLDDRPVEVNVNMEPEENWCTDTHTGRFVCIALPIITGLAAIAGGVILFDYLDDGSADGIIHW